MNAYSPLTFLSAVLFFCVATFADENSEPTSPSRESFDKPSLPAVVRLAPDGIRDAWTEANRACELNETFTAHERQADPYVIRARVWLQLNCGRDAFRDLVSAISILRKRDSLSQFSLAEVEDLLIEALQVEERLPGRPSVHAPRRYWGIGHASLLQGQHERALFYFQDAQRLAPDDPLFRYCASMALYNLGLTDAAFAEARIGMSTEFAMTPALRRTYHHRHFASLELVSGEARTWLEQTRFGLRRSDVEADLERLRTWGSQ